MVGSLVSKFLNLNASVTNRDVEPKQRYDRFPSVEDHIHATTRTYYYKRFLEITNSKCDVCGGRDGS